MFGPWTTLLLAIALVVPFGVTQVTNVEPFPALLFPSGATSVTTTGSVVQYGGVVVSGYDEDGNTVDIDAGALLDPVRVQYLEGLANTSFGLAIGGDREIVIMKLGWSVTVDGPELSDRDRDEVRDWLKGRLHRLGLAADRIVVRRVWITADARTGVEIMRTIGHEDVIPL